MFVKPAAGLDLRDPERNDRLPKDKYRLVPDSDYWMRRRRDGDVVTHANPPIAEMEGYEPPEGSPSETRVPRRLPADPPSA